MNGPSPSNRLVCSAAAALLAALLVVIASPVALAHAVLVASEPADGAMLADPPARLTLTFNEPVSPLVVRLIGPDGMEQGITGVKQEGAVLAVAPSGELGNGTHLLSWRVVSADGHPVGGAVVFSVGAASESGPPSIPAASAATKYATWVTRVAIYLAMFVGVGGVFFVCWAGSSPPDAVERVLHAVLLAGLVAVPVSVGLQGADLLGLSLPHLANSAVWQTGLRSSYAATAAIAFVSFFAAQLAISASSRQRARIASAVGFAGVGFALAASGHASAAEPQLLMRPAVFVHALGIAFWIGALLPLAGLLLARTQDAHTSLRRFSRMAPFAVAALIASGAVLALVQVGEVSALLHTDYGRVFLIKAALLAVLFSVALYNRVRLTGRVLADEREAGRRLVRTVSFEIALALAIFAAVATWRFTPPPRALAVLAAAPVTVHIHTQRAMADIRFESGRTGPTAASIALMTGDFGPLDAKEVMLVLSRRDSGIEPVRRPATRRDDGRWYVDDLFVPVAGLWAVRIDVLIGDFERVSLEDTLVFQPD